MTQALTFGGYDLTQHCFVRIDDPVGAPTRVDTVQATGRDGDVVTSVALDPIVITAHCTVRALARSRWDAVRREIAAAFAVRGQRVLTLPDEDGLWRYATASLVGSLPLPLEAPSVFDVEFCCHDPVAYGPLRAVTVPPGSTSVTLEVGGTAPTRPVVECPSAGYQPSGDTEGEDKRLWALVDESGSSMGVVLPDLGAGGHTTLSIDCQERVVLVGGDVAALTLDSNWLELTPGTNRLTLAASGRIAADATISFYERWY